MERLAFGPAWKFGNRDEVLLGDAFGPNLGILRNGDREAFGGIGPVSQDRPRACPRINSGWRADQGAKRVKPWLYQDWLGWKAYRGVSSDPWRLSGTVQTVR